MQTGTLSFQRRQFPVKVAYAISANRTQGATLIRVGADARFSFFSHGQMYVVESRVQNRQSIAFGGLPPLPPGQRHALLNIVYRDMIDPDVARRPLPAHALATPRRRRTALLNLDGAATSSDTSE